MKTEITQQDLENPQRFIAEGLGAPEFEVVRNRTLQNNEAEVQLSTGCLHHLRSKE